MIKKCAILPGKYKLLDSNAVYNTSNELSDHILYMEKILKERIKDDTKFSIVLTKFPNGDFSVDSINNGLRDLFYVTAKGCGHTTYEYSAEKIGPRENKRGLDSRHYDGFGKPDLEKAIKWLTGETK